MRRQLSENGLLQHYNAELRFALHVRMIVALAFVRINNLDDAFDALSNELANELYVHPELVGRQLYRPTWT